MDNNNDDSNNKESRPPPPRFGGPDMATANICFDANEDDVGHEETRRVGFNPSFAPSNITFEAPMAPMSHAQGAFSTAAPKAAAISVPTTTGRFSWNLPEAPTLPEFHPLERTAVFVPNSEAPKVAGRISNVLRDRSIEASFDDDKGRARCVTGDGVDFRVRLYRGRNQYSHGIIVEVQRRFGTSLTFHSDCIAILDAAEGKTPSPPPLKPAALPLTAPQDDNYTPSAGSSLAMVARMLAFQGYDAQYLAMQTLTSLTDPAKVGPATSKSVSMELLGSSNDVGAKMLMLILSSPSANDEAFELRVMAMNVLANVLEVAASGVPEQIKAQLRPVMKQDLNKAESNPRLATIAARCVEYMIDHDENASDIYYDALEAAFEAGSHRHAALMRQAEKCLQKIGAR